jgi:8-oxo-dGTP pyrophosphatase MutT (NUDIX family)
LVRTHKGQIGLPGGRQEATDQTPIVTALRETFEEIGVTPDGIKVHGCLPWARSLDQKLIIPIVGTAPLTPEQFKANDEVSQIIPVDWRVFHKERSQRFGFTMFGHRRNSYLFQYEDHNIWGLTAKILAEAGFCEPIL